MIEVGPIQGFSKLSKEKKLDFLSNTYLQGEDKRSTIESFWHSDDTEQKRFEEFSENTITNFFVPYGTVPNLLLNNQLYCVPMAIEESSVVAAASSAAKFWLNRGGISSTVISTIKSGQVHMTWDGDSGKLFDIFQKHKKEIIQEIYPLSESMEERGGGVCDILLEDRSHYSENYYQLQVSFETCDAMGANFINTILEAIAGKFKELVDAEIASETGTLTIIMAILSNYTPECLVHAEVSCSISELEDMNLGMSASEFVNKFKKAVEISKINVSRAVTHNKGIFNGIDAVVVATGNDYRAVEACGHAYATRSGRYEGLTDVKVEGDRFTFSMNIPLALGTVGGLTGLHPMAAISLEMMGSPSAPELMQIACSVGLLQNFAALRSLVTSGIQKGHMRMHLMNILNQLHANESERVAVKNEFEGKSISFKGVREFLSNIREYH